MRKSTCDLILFNWLVDKKSQVKNKSIVSKKKLKEKKLRLLAVYLWPRHLSTTSTRWIKQVLAIYTLGATGHTNAFWLTLKCGAPERQIVAGGTGSECFCRFLSHL